MQRLNSFIKKSIVGGFLVILPTVIIFLAFRWAFNTVTDFIHPITAPIAENSSAPEYAVDLLVIAMILLGCFIVGNIVTTGAGKWLHSRFDTLLSKLAPGYNLVREVTHQILGDKNDSPFSRGEVALIKLFGNDTPTEVTGIVTSRHSDGGFTVFIPTGPNPTSGMIYHLPADQVKLMPSVKVEAAFKTIIACGAGSGELFANSININQR